MKARIGSKCAAVRKDLVQLALSQGAKPMMLKSVLGRFACRVTTLGRIACVSAKHGSAGSMSGT
jgi:hypothetical protein